MSRKKEQMHYHSPSLAHPEPEKWTHWDLNPGLSACEADVIPLHHAPYIGFLHVQIPLDSNKIGINGANAFTEKYKGRTSNHRQHAEYICLLQNQQNITRFYLLHSECQLATYSSEKMQHLGKLFEPQKVQDSNTIH